MTMGGMKMEVGQWRNEGLVKSGIYLCDGKTICPNLHCLQNVSCKKVPNAERGVHSDDSC